MLPSHALPKTPRKPGHINPEAEAAGLLEACRIQKAPVAVEQIAERLGLSITYQPFRGPQQRDVSGMLYRGRGLAVLGVNAAHSRTRQRFTVAHEIGHYRLHPGQEVWIDHLIRAQVNFRDALSSQGVMREEVQANQFAAALLMPAKQLIGDTIDMLDDDSTATAQDVVRQMARRYEVSQQSMEYRLINLGLLDPETR